VKAREADVGRKTWRTYVPPTVECLRKRKSSSSRKCSRGQSDGRRKTCVTSVGEGFARPPRHRLGKSSGLSGRPRRSLESSSSPPSRGVSRPFHVVVDVVVVVVVTTAAAAAAAVAVSPENIQKPRSSACRATSSRGREREAFRVCERQRKGEGGNARVS
jgi:hypothetical protein